jgi:hypothetical protein
MPTLQKLCNLKSFQVNNYFLAVANALVRAWQCHARTGVTLFWALESVAVFNPKAVG